MNLEEAQALIVEVCDDVKEMLLDKNSRYGNSAMDPVRILSDADPIAQLEVRADDKLSRILRGAKGEDREDAIKDLTGYLILLECAKRYEGKP